MPTALRRWLATAAIYTDRRAITLFLLGIAAGLPFLLIFSSLSIWLNEAGVARDTVTRFSWAALGAAGGFAATGAGGSTARLFLGDAGHCH